MKVIKASSVVAGNDGYICYLTRKEAQVICSLTGSCAPAGGGATDYTNAVYHALENKGVEYHSIIGGAVISVTGDIE